MLGSTLATVPGVTVDWNDKGRITFPLLSLEETHQVVVHTTPVQCSVVGQAPDGSGELMFLDNW